MAAGAPISIAAAIIELPGELCLSPRKSGVTTLSERQIDVVSIRRTGRVEIVLSPPQIVRLTEVGSSL